jgi:hypothetical protein
MNRPGFGEFANVPGGIHLTPPTEKQKKERSKNYTGTYINWETKYDEIFIKYDDLKRKYNNLKEKYNNLKWEYNDLKNQYDDY